MSGFFFAFLAVLVASLGARDQALLAALVRTTGPRGPVLAVALVGAVLAASFAGWAASRLLVDLAAPARAMLAALGLILAGAEMLVLRPARHPAEPTRSLFAAFLVFTALQVSDAARLLVFALGVATAAPVPAVLGGAAASAMALVAAWLVPDAVFAPAVRQLRRIGGAAFLALGLWQLIGKIAY